MWPAEKVDYERNFAIARGQLEQIERGQIDLRVGMLAEIAGKLKTTVTQLLQGVA